MFLLEEFPFQMFYVQLADEKSVFSAICTRSKHAVKDLNCQRNVFIPYGLDCSVSQVCTKNSTVAALVTKSSRVH